MTAQRRRGQAAKVWRTVTTTDRRGNVIKAATDVGPYDVRIWVIPQRSSRAEVPGQQEIDVVRIGLSPDYDDVTLWSRVEWQGAQWDVVTPPEYHHGVKRHTRHWTIDLRRRP